MKKDIEIKKVEDILIAVAPRLAYEEDADFFWDAYLINLKNQPIRSVMVTSTGYGEVDGEPRRSSTLRYFFDEVASCEWVKIESIQTSLFQLASEYWLSFALDDYLYDKKFVFMPGSFEPMNLTHIPVLNRQGVMIG